MDLLYKIEIKVSPIVNLFFPGGFFSYEQIFLRYVKRLTRCLSTGTLKTPIQADEDVVWVFWAQGEQGMPKVVRNCVDSIKANCGRKVRLLDLNSLQQFIEIPNLIKLKLESGKLSLIHFSDWLRFALLSRYGGWWIDATVFLTEKLPNENGVFTIRHQDTRKFISRSMWTSFIWHLPVGHPLALFVSKGIVRYFEKNDTITEYLLLDYLIRTFYERNAAFQKTIEQLDETNPHIYFFQTEECLHRFNKARWDEIRQQTTVFKTSYKINTINYQRDSYIGTVIFGMG